MTRVLLTGATGFIGSQAIWPLRERGYEVHAIGRTPPSDPSVVFHRADLLDADGTAREVSAASCSHLLHLAWSVPPGLYWSAASNLDWVAASLALVRRFVEAGGSRAVVAGTCAEYEWGTPRFVEGVTPYRPASLYGAAKDGLRRLLAAYAETGALSLAWGHVFFLYGPGEPAGRLVSEAARTLLAGKPFDTTDGRQRRDFLHVADVAGAFAALLDSPVTGAVNIGSGAAVPVRDLLTGLGDATGRADLIRFGARALAASEPPVIEADCGRLGREVGFSPGLDLDAGLSNTLAWWADRIGP